MSYYTHEQVKAAIKQHSTMFFDGNLQPVVPQEKQWFCEFHICEGRDGFEVRDEAIVEYLGTSNACYFVGKELVNYVDHRVASEYDEADRRPHGDILVLQS